MFRSGLIEEDEFHAALGELVDTRTIDQIINHPELGEETLDRLLMHARERCAPFFRLNDRMRMHLSSHMNEQIWFDVDMENLLSARQTYSHSSSTRQMKHRTLSSGYRLPTSVQTSAYIDSKPNPTPMTNYLERPLTRGFPPLCHRRGLFGRPSSHPLWAMLL